MGFVDTDDQQAHRIGWYSAFGDNEQKALVSPVICPNSGVIMNYFVKMSNLVPDILEICAGMFLLPGFVDSSILRPELESVLKTSPLRKMQTSRGFEMSVHNSNCGKVGWISDRNGYRYSKIDPQTGNSWPAMPDSFLSLAQSAAEEAGFLRYQPDACLINQYRPGNQMGAHQDRDEQDFDAPIVSVSLGIDARFFVIGPERRGKSIPVDLSDGDVLVFGGPARMFYHGVRKLKHAVHPIWGATRWNLTFRQAL